MPPPIREAEHRTYVLCGVDQLVIGYYSLSVATVSHAAATGSLKRNMPEPVPMMLLGRLAVDHRWHGRGIGGGLLKDAVLRTLQVAEIAGIRGILVHALSDAAKRFYQNAGFAESPADPMTLMVLLSDLRKTVEAID